MTAAPRPTATAAGVVDTVGPRDRLRHRPAEFSGARRQRVAAARAFAAE
ncbi:hypothetical protein [Streptomyces crystallinus]|uniref:Uncharacterized protein n=1 Tax=Streptomyces crystallinus TaxID=68191 RepID=A0ABP3Q5S6_9ACTN